MIGITKLLCGTAQASDVLRYGADSAKLPTRLLQFSRDERPVVVWNCTAQCNLRCIHCYICARDAAGAGELSTAEARAMIDDLAQMGAPVLLFSGGEPFCRDDVFDLAAYAHERGIRPVASTNGTLLTPKLVERAKAARFQYMGISLDGKPATNDAFRGSAGAFERGLEGLRNCKAAGLKVGLRFTVCRRNVADLPFLFDLIESEGIGRFCLYHLVYTGRGAALRADDLSHEETREMMDWLFAKAQELHARGNPCEILTVDNHADGAYLYLRLLKESPGRAEEAMRLLRMNGGNGTGTRIGAVDPCGNVHPDQFWQHATLGNVRERPFSAIWSDTSNPLMEGLKRKKAMIHGRCASCRFLDICGGNFRVRAEAATGDVWACDPACYLTDAEIGIENPKDIG